MSETLIFNKEKNKSLCTNVSCLLIDKQWFCSHLTDLSVHHFWPHVSFQSEYYHFLLICRQFPHCLHFNKPVHCATVIIFLNLTIGWGNLLKACPSSQQSSTGNTHHSMHTEGNLDSLTWYLCPCELLYHHALPRTLEYQVSTDISK